MPKNQENMRIKTQKHKKHEFSAKFSKNLTGKVFKISEAMWNSFDF